MKALATAVRSLSLYTVLAIVIGAQGALLLFVHKFGNPQADVWVGAILAGAAVLAVVGHVWLSGVSIPVPPGVYSAMIKINGVIVGILAASGMIVQYVGTLSPQLTPIAALILQGLALVASVFAALFKASAAGRTAPRVV